MFNQTIGFRLQAANHYPISPQLFWQYFFEDKVLVILSVLFFLPLVIDFLYKKISLNSLILILWLFSTVIFIIFFRPIFHHHLSLLVVPLILSIVLLVDDLIELQRKNWLILLIIIVLLIAEFKSIKRYEDRLTRKEGNLINLIKDKTDEKDFIIIDEAKFYYLSRRLPPPELVDTSFVRIISGNLNKKNFSLLVNRYKPKLIIFWNGRLARLTNNGNDLIDLGYKKISFYGADKLVYSLTSCCQK